MLISLKDNQCTPVAWKADWGNETCPAETLTALQGFNNTKLTQLLLNDFNGDKFLFFPSNEVKADLKDEKFIYYMNDGDPDRPSFQTGNVMGFFSVGENVRVHISSRFDNFGKNYFLHYMLQKVCNVAYTPRTDSGEDEFYDFLYQLFPYYLNQALAQGLYRAYVTREYNDANVRGPIDINRHIRYNIPFNGRIAYHTREYTTDNSITQLIRHTIEYIRSLQYGKIVVENSADTDLRDNIMAIEMATPTYNRNARQNVIRDNLRPVIHPYYTAYEPLRKLCLAILSNQKLSYGENAEDQIAGILFDGASLWEEYLNSVMQKRLGKRLLHPNNRTGFGRQYFFSGTAGDIFPDFLLDIFPDEKDVNTAAQVLDAKYRANALDSDVYKQMLSYMFRFDSKISKLLYPTDCSDDQNENYCGKTLYLRRDESVMVKTQPFHVPKYEKNDSFENFCSKMTNAEEQFLKDLCL